MVTFIKDMTKNHEGAKLLKLGRVLGETRQDIAVKAGCRSIVFQQKILH